MATLTGLKTSSPTTGFISREILLVQLAIVHALSYLAGLPCFILFVQTEKTLRDGGNCELM